MHRMCLFGCKTKNIQMFWSTTSYKVQFNINKDVNWVLAGGGMKL